MSAFDQLDNEHHDVWFDNLHPSTHFAKACHSHEKEIGIAEPTQKSDRGLPKSVMQEKIKNKRDIGNCKAQSKLQWWKVTESVLNQ